jgi:1-aminocyclopropane-1-carboxylate deaminase/D-cysteine desulfhydrase-like pyridoxal-dependent ACC family enzyme
MNELSPAEITIDPVLLNNVQEKKIALFTLRLDRIHPLISGNKWFKLRYHIQHALRTEAKSILTFGGAWSNHILATAAACKLHGLSATGLIRGERPVVLSPVLSMAAEMGMELVFLSREKYASKTIPSAFTPDLYYLIPEGGYGEEGARGAATITAYFPPAITHIACAVGTGTTLAGLANAISSEQEILGISVLKNNIALEDAVINLLTDKSRPFSIHHEYHFGGYAKKTPELLEFMNELYESSGIPTDFIYTGKLFYAINDLIRKDYFPEGSRILVIHSGGLSGNLSLRKGSLIF